MTNTWILVADSTRARLFEQGPADKTFGEVACFTNPDGHAPGRRAAEDRLPRVNESVGRVRHAIEPRTSLRDKSTDHFAHTLAEALAHGHNDHLYDRLVLVAPAHFLGVLRGNLGKLVAGCIVGEIGRNLTTRPVAELHASLPREMLVAGLAS